MFAFLTYKSKTGRIGAYFNLAFGQIGALQNYGNLLKIQKFTWKEGFYSEGLKYPKEAGRTARKQVHTTVLICSFDIKVIQSNYCWASLSIFCE